MFNIICFHGRGQNPVIFKSLVNSLHNNNKEYKWIFLKGNYSLPEGGWGWYKYNNDCIDNKSRKKNIDEMCDFIGNNNTVLLGFSEGGQFALDLAQQLPNIKGVIALSPSWDSEMGNNVIECPVVLITSKSDRSVKPSVSNKWKKYITNVSEINHGKGHKVYLPLETRQIINTKIFI